MKKPERIALLTDSTCDLAEEIVAQYGINVIPLRVRYQNQEYRDGIDITSAEVYARLTEEIPQTSLPFMDDIAQMFSRLRDEGFTHVVAVHISGAMSGTGQAVALAARDFSDLVVEVVDSCMLALGLGMMVVDAACEIRAATPFQQIVKLVSERRKELHGYFVLNTLEYLWRGGRISHAACSIGNFLNIKPLVSVNDAGNFYIHSKLRGREKSLQRLVETLIGHVKQVAASGRQATVSVFHGDALEEARKIEKLARSMPDVKEVFFSTLGPVLGVHTGPGLVGIGIAPHYGKGRE